MTFNERLSQICSNKNSLVCVGLDVDLTKIPKFILEKKSHKSTSTRQLSTQQSKISLPIKMINQGKE
ncbi:hypothetical protein L0Z72_05100 [candidate division KSB1 bacterium]|nr:hypothetical protein [candidate division KSB1 bacterium]